MSENGATKEPVLTGGTPDPGVPSDLASALRPALAELLKAHDYARRTGRKNWEFAVEIGRLRVLRLTESDFRWLICEGYVEHAQEVTRLEDQERQFRPTQRLSFSKHECFVLTARGAELACGTTKATAHGCDGVAPPAPVPDERPHAKDATPHWDRERHELRVDGVLVKRFKWPAVNQETIIAAFEEEGWPPRIDDPLPPQGEQSSQRRLNDTIKCLNRNQTHKLICFRGDGTGEGVLWEFTDGAETPAECASPRTDGRSPTPADRRR